MTRLPTLLLLFLLLLLLPRSSHSIGRTLADCEAVAASFNNTCRFPFQAAESVAALERVLEGQLRAIGRIKHLMVLGAHEARSGGCHLARRR